MTDQILINDKPMDQRPPKRLSRFLMLSGAAAGFVLLAGCASTSQVADASLGQIPQNFAELNGDKPKASQSRPLPLNWVTSLEDPTVEKLIAEAMAHNNNLAAAAERVLAARKGAVATRAGLLPSLSAGVDVTRQSDPAEKLIPNNDGGLTDAPLYSFAPTLSWELDIWARLTDQTRASYLDAAASRADFDASRLSIAGAVAQNWYSLVAARLQRELAERDVATGEANLRITTRRYERGISSPLDVRLARSSLAGSQATLLSRQRAEKELARTLELLLGRYPSAEIQVSDKLPALTSLSEEDGTVIGIGTPQSVLERRPDLIAAEARMRSDGLDARAARKALLPSLRLTASGSSGATDFEDIFDLDRMVTTLVGSLTQPIFQAGRVRANASASEALARASAYTYAQTVLTAYSEIENALMNESILEAREIALRLAYEEAVAVEELTQRQYTNGTSDIFNLINAQQRRIQSESQFIQSQTERLSNRINLYMALGGTFAAGDDPYERIATGRKKNTDGAFQLPQLNLFNRWWRADDADPSPDTQSRNEQAEPVLVAADTQTLPGAVTGEIQ